MIRFCFYDRVRFIILISFILAFNYINCQDQRLQFPKTLANSFTGVHAGYINYRFTVDQLEPGFSVKNIKVPHAAVRVILFGHEFNKFLAAQVSYMRPVNWVEYQDVNGDGKNHTVWMNVAGLSAKSNIPLSKKFKLFAEAGFALVTRSGFSINDIPVVKDANYGSLLFGAGMKYHMDANRDIGMSFVTSPKNKNSDQPATVFYSAGFIYNLRPYSKEKLEVRQRSRYIFPRNSLQVGITSNIVGYEANNFVSKKVPIFWGGEVKIQNGFSLQYRRNIFHGKKVFAIDWGADLSYWRTLLQEEDLFTASLFPLFRFYFLRREKADFYFNYALAGPAFISKPRLDGRHTGKRFTFHDFMGLGVYSGKKRQLNAEIRIAHYSNGNLFPENAGLKIPLSFNFGYAFK